MEIVVGKAATVEGRADKCIMCGQCVAVCPTEALQMPKIPAEDFKELARLPFDYKKSIRRDLAGVRTI